MVVARLLKRKRQARSPASVRPYIGWDLALQPRPLHEAFWDEQASKYARWDAQVAWFFAFLLVMLSLHSAKAKDGWQQSWRVFAPAYLNQACWLLALCWPRFWCRNRRKLLVVVRAALTYQTLHATNQARPRLYELSPSSHRAPRTTTLLKIALIANAPYFPVWIMCMPLPLRLQLVVTALQAVVLFLGGCTRELVTLNNTPLYLGILQSSNASWLWLVQSGWRGALAAEPAPQLAGRSAHTTLAAMSVYLTTLAVTMYLVYVYLWSELRQWLRAKAALMQAEGGAPGGPSRAAAPRDGAATINGVPVSREQLLRMARSPAAQLLLDGRGVLGYASMALLHGALLYSLCLACMLASQVLVMRVGPRVLPAPLLALYYPLRPEVEQGACAPGNEPQFVGVLGRVLLALGGGEHWLSPR